LSTNLSTNQPTITATNYTAKFTAEIAAIFTAIQLNKSYESTKHLPYEPIFNITIRTTNNGIKLTSSITTIKHIER
jgi:hypothetical protein